MPYNLTNVTNSNNPWEMLYHLNKLADGLIGIMLLVAVFIIVFFVFKKREKDTKEVLLVDSLISTFLAILLWAAQLIEWFVIIYPMVLLFVSILVYKFSE